VLRVRDEKDRLILCVRRSTERLYLLRVKLAQPLCLAARTTNSAWLWHERFGHMNFDALHKMEKRGMVQGLPPIDRVHQLCTECVTTKLKRRPFIASEEAGRGAAGSRPRRPLRSHHAGNSRR
jgi:hypothetical protein